MPMSTEHRKQATALAKTTQNISRLIRNAKFRAALDEFHDDPNARKAASKDTTKYLERRGVTIPEGLKITLKDNNWSVSLCAKVAIFELCIKFDVAAGWSMAR